jgi:hypothetical protein
MIPTFGRMRERRINWRRELPPVLAVAGLAADYLSPPALWTMLLPFGCVVMLIAMRKWFHAAAVFMLCSWVLVPLAAGTTTAVEDARGQHRLYVVDDGVLPSLDEAALDPCARNIALATLPIGADQVLHARGPLRRAIETFADLHNLMVIDRLHPDDSDTCAP